MMRMLVWNLTSAYLQPTLHHLYLVGLRQLDTMCQHPHVLASGPRRQQRSHVECLRVVMDHCLHESNVSICMLDSGKVHRFIAPDSPAWRAWDSRLNNAPARSPARCYSNENQQCYRDPYSAP